MNHLAVAFLTFFLGKVLHVYEAVDIKLQRFLMSRLSDDRFTVKFLRGDEAAAGKSTVNGSSTFSASSM